MGYFLLSTQLNVAVTLRAVSLAGPGATGPLYGLAVGLSLGLMGFAATAGQLVVCVALC